MTAMGRPDGAGAPAWAGVDTHKHTNALALLDGIGVTETDDPSKADILMVNTCGFIHDAKEQSIETIFDLIREKKEGQKLIVSGCLSQRYAKELAKEMPEVDAFLGVNDYMTLPKIVRDTEKTRIAAKPAAKTYEELPRKFSGGVSASIKIAEGCNNICTYCAIPFIRGRYRSRKPEAILAEAEQLAKEGVQELVVIAEDVTGYGRDLKTDYLLPQLLHDLCRIDGFRWIRLMYCYEDEITPELIETIKTEPKICHYLDIPIQHSVDRVLKAMNRKSTETSIRATITELRKQIPDIVIRTTLITGFPGETKEDMLASVRYLNGCDIQGVKLQLLHVLAGTDLGELYLAGAFGPADGSFPFTLPAYADLICDCIGALKKDITVHRITGDAPKRILLSPTWSGNKKLVLNTIRKRLEDRGITQGCSLPDQISMAP